MTQSTTQLKKEKLPTSGIALASLILGLFFFIPLFGFLTGAVAVILGIAGLRQVKNGKNRGMRLAIAGIVLGVVGMLFTVGIYSALFYFAFVSKTGPYAEMKPMLDQRLLTQTAGALELYKQKFQKYPSNLEELKNADYMIYETDAYGKPFYYELKGSSYELRGLGSDGTYNTVDDTFAVK